MLFMVIERIRGGDPAPVGERFRTKGRMLPPGVVYLSSWVEPSSGRCFQLMEGPDAASLDEWIRKWDDLVEFEVVHVLTSAEYWAHQSGRNGCTSG